MKCVGLFWRPAEAQARAMELTPGDKLTLKAEPTNEFDPNAVMVFTEDDVHIGYVPKEDAPFFKGVDPLPTGVFQEFVQLEGSSAVHLYFDLEEAKADDA